MEKIAIVKAGRSTRMMELKRYALRGVLTFAACFLLWGCLKLLSGPMTLAGVVGVLILVKVIDAVGTSMIDRVHKREKDAGRGAEAEEKVGELLDSLDPTRFQVFHDRVLGFGNIDHLVIRRDGAIFAIETKSHAGKITWDGQQLLRSGKPLEKDFIKQTLGNALTLGKHIGGYAEREIWVHGILCFTRGFVQVKAPIKGVQVLPSKWILEKLEATPVKPGNAEVADWIWEHFGTLLTLPTKQ